MPDSETTVVVHPGDIVQTSDGMLLLVQQTFGWGIGATLNWVDRGRELSSYHRLKPGHFVVVGTAHLLPEDVSKSRRDSLKAEREAKGPPVTAETILRDVLAAFDADADAMADAVARAFEFLGEPR